MPDIYVAPPVPVKSKKKSLTNKKGKLKDSLLKLGIHPGRNLLAAFIPLPQKVKFDMQEEDEKIILLLRRHWITNLPWILLSLLAIFLPLVLTILPLLNFFPIRYQLIIIVMWYLLVLSFVFDRFLSWFYNVYIITDERVIDVDFISLVYREISQAALDKIQDVTFKSGGLIKTLFDYGDVIIQTAAAVQTIEFELVPQPAKIAHVLNELIEAEEKEDRIGRGR